MSKGLEALKQNNYLVIIPDNNMLKYNCNEEIIEKELKALEFIKELLNLKVIEFLPNDSDTRLFVNCGNFKASVLIPPAYIDLLKDVLNYE